MGFTEVPAGTTRGAAKILVIDDDKKHCRLLTGYLELSGYEVTSVQDGGVGVGKVSTERWDLVILDVMLPRMDGFEVLKRIRTHSAVPVLMLTARGDESDRIVGLEIGADEYVPKTFLPYQAYNRGTFVPSSPGVFWSFNQLTGNALTYCSISSGVGKNVQISTVAANLACGTGIGAVGQTLPNYIGTDSPYTQGEYSNFLTSAGAGIGSPANAKGGIVQVPALVGAIALPFNNPDVAGNLSLTVQQVCNIFGGTYTNWSQVGLPSRPISWIYRSLGSGTTFAFANFIAANCNQANGGPIPPTSPGIAKLKTDQLYANTGMSATTGEPSNINVVNRVAATPGSIGYADVADVVNVGTQYILIGTANPTTFTSPLFTSSDVLVDRVVNGVVASTGLPNLTAKPGTSYSSLLMINPAKTAGAGYPIFAATYLAAYARGNDDADVGGDNTAASNLQALFTCLTDNTNQNCFNLPTNPDQAVLPVGFGYVRFDATALGVVNNAISQIQN